MSLISSIFKSRASSKAAKAQVAASDRMADTYQNIYDDTVQRNEFREGVGNRAIGKLADMYGVGENQQQQPTQGASMFNFGGAGQQFNPQSYLQANPGVANAYRPGLHGANSPEEFAQIHWDANGQSEGRPGAFTFADQMQPYGKTQNPYGQPQIPSMTPQGGQMGQQSTMPQQTPQGGSTGPFADFYNSPDYQLAFNEGQSAIEGGAAARGGLLSGNTAKAVTEFGQNLATGTYGNYKGALQNLAGTGAQASQNVTGAGNTYAQGYGNTQIMGANAQSQNAMNQGNIWGGFANAGANALMGGFGG